MRTTLFAAVLLTCHAARAEGSSFGDQGVIVPSGVVSFDYNRTNSGGLKASTWVLQIAPRLMYFVADDIAIGGDLALVVTKPVQISGTGMQADTYTTFGIGPRAGYNLRINDTVSFFPSAALHIFAGNGILRLPLDIEAPFLIHFGNFFIGVGPALAVDIWGRYRFEGALGDDDSVGYRMISFLLTTTLGGWIPAGGGGDWDDVVPPPEASPHEPAPPLEPVPPPDSAPAEPAPTAPVDEEEWT